MSDPESKHESASAAHSDELSHVEPDDIGVGMMTVLFGLCGISLLLIVVLLQAWFYNWKDAVVADRPAEVNSPTTAAAIAAEQLKRIEGYGWADAKKTVRTIPISRAMDLIVDEYGEGTSGGEKVSEKK
jgi:hypothetical protein